MPQAVGPKIQTVSLTLNEYLRFEKAGHYRLYVLSSRLFPADKQFGGMFTDTPVASDTIEFDILEGDDWAQNRAREIEVMLSAPADKTAPAGKDEIRYGTLARELHFLDTPLSRRLMIANYGSAKFQYDGEFHFGLMGTRDPNDAASAMRERLQNPDGAVSSGFLQDLTTLLFMQSDAPARLLYPNKAAEDSPEMKQFRAIARVREQKRSAIARALVDDLTRALPAKRGTARAISLTTIIESLGAAQKLTRGANAVSNEPATQNLRRQLITSWNDLPRESQKTLLAYRWPLIRDPALLPLLTRATDAPPINNPNQSDNFEEREWRSLLLLRLTQLSPATGLKYSQAEMKRPDPRVESGVLLDVPDSTLPALPALEAAWLRNLRNDPENNNEILDNLRILQQVARYASPQIAEPLKAWLEKNPDVGRDGRAAVLAYFARVRPDEIAALIEADIKVHRQPMLEAIGAFAMNDSVEAVAIKYLHGANQPLAVDAAWALAKYGSPKAEVVLWDRWEKWHAGLAGKTLDSQQIEFEAVLAQSLTRMPGVQTKRANLEKLRALCRSAHGREQLSSSYFPKNGYGVAEIRYHPALFNHYAWSFGRNRDGYWSLPALTQKLRQFPRGTSFSFHIEGVEASPDAQAVTARLQAWLRPHGYTLKLEK